MNKPVRYALAVLACVACYAVCIALMVVTGIGGVLAMVLMCFAIKHVWNAIVHYGEELDDTGEILETKDEQYLNESKSHETEYTSGTAE